MNNILSHLLIKLAEKEVKEKELYAKINSLEMLVFAAISTLDNEKLNELARKIKNETADGAQCATEGKCLADELSTRSINLHNRLSPRD